jgi:CrcB protein
MMPVLLVALGGALGAVARFLVGSWFVRKLGASWPFATLFINLSGCFFIALFLTAAAERIPGLNGGWRYLFPIGFVGAYTTFSTYEYELAQLVSSGQVAAAFGYFAASNLLGFAAVLFGSWLARAP